VPLPAPPPGVDRAAHNSLAALMTPPAGVAPAVAARSWTRVWAFCAGRYLLLAGGSPWGFGVDWGMLAGTHAGCWLAGTSGVNTALEAQLPGTCQVAGCAARAEPGYALGMRRVCPHTPTEAAAAATAASESKGVLHASAATAAAPALLSAAHLLLPPAWPPLLAVLDVASSPVFEVVAPAVMQVVPEPHVWQLRLSAGCLATPVVPGGGSGSSGGGLLRRRVSKDCHAPHDASLIAFTFACGSRGDAEDWLAALRSIRRAAETLPQALHWSAPPWVTAWMAASGYCAAVCAPSPPSSPASSPPRGGSLAAATAGEMGGFVAAGTAGVVGHPLLSYAAALGRRDGLPDDELLAYVAPPTCRLSEAACVSRLPAAVANLPLTLCARGASVRPLADYIIPAGSVAVKKPEVPTLQLAADRVVSAALGFASPPPPAAGAGGAMHPSPSLRSASLPVTSSPTAARTFTRTKRVGGGTSAVAVDGTSATTPPATPVLRATAGVALVGGGGAPTAATAALAAALTAVATAAAGVLGEGAFGRVLLGYRMSETPVMREWLSRCGGSSSSGSSSSSSGSGSIGAPSLERFPVAVKVVQLPQPPAVGAPPPIPPVPRRHSVAVTPPPTPLTAQRDALRRWRVAINELLALERVTWAYAYAARWRPRDAFPTLPLLLDVAETLVGRDRPSLVPAAAPSTSLYTSELYVVLNLVQGVDLYTVASTLAPIPASSGGGVKRKTAADLAFPVCPYPLTFSPAAASVGAAAAAVSGGPAPPVPTLTLAELVAVYAGDEAAAAPTALPEAMARSIVLDVAAALARLHALGIAHRDVKPENVQVVAVAPASGKLPVVRAVLLDLGFACVAEARPGVAHADAIADASELTLRTLFGTKHAAAPEIWTAADAATERQRSARDATTPTSTTPSRSGAGSAWSLRSASARVAPPSLPPPTPGRSADSTAFRYTSAVDAWGLGVVMYVALFGTLPFDDSGGTGELRSNIVAGRLVESVPGWLAGRDAPRAPVRGLLRGGPPAPPAPPPAPAAPARPPPF